MTVKCWESSWLWFKTKVFFPKFKICFQIGISFYLLYKSHLTTSFLIHILQGCYMTIHITPEQEFSYVSFETNVASSDYADLIARVIETFQPGKFVVTVLANKVRNVTDAADSSQSNLIWNLLLFHFQGSPAFAASRALEHSDKIRNWARRDIQFCRLASYDLIYCLYTKFPSWGSLCPPLTHGVTTYPSHSLFPFLTCPPPSKSHPFPKSIPKVHSTFNVSSKSSIYHATPIKATTTPTSGDDNQQQQSSYFALHLKNAQEIFETPRHQQQPQSKRLSVESTGAAGLILILSFMYVMMRQVADFSRYLMWRNKISWGLDQHHTQAHAELLFGSSSQATIGLGSLIGDDSLVGGFSGRFVEDRGIVSLVAYFVSWFWQMEFRRFVIVGDFGGIACIGQLLMICWPWIVWRRMWVASQVLGHSRHHQFNTCVGHGGRITLLSRFFNKFRNNHSESTWYTVELQVIIIIVFLRLVVVVCVLGGFNKQDSERDVTNTLTNRSFNLVRWYSEEQKGIARGGGVGRWSVGLETSISYSDLWCRWWIIQWMNNWEYFFVPENN